jgi:Zn-dependent protease
MFGYLAWVNLLLAGFNLVPGFPLDGGRLHRPRQSTCPLGIQFA